MPWAREITKRARKHLAGIPINHERQALATAIEHLADDPGAADIAKIGDGTWRLRVGRWRVIFEMDNDAGIIRILRILRRNEGTYRT